MDLQGQSQDQLVDILIKLAGSLKEEDLQDPATFALASQLVQIMEPKADPLPQELVDQLKEIKDKATRFKMAATSMGAQRPDLIEKLVASMKAAGLWKSETKPEHFLEHYSSHHEPISLIDPAFHGKGVSGDERKRTERIPRSYYYDAGSEPEARVAGPAKYKYIVKAPPKILDVAHPDAKHLIEASKTSAGIVDDTELERNIRNAGHDGYRNTASSLPNAVALFHAHAPHETHSLKKSDVDFLFKADGKKDFSNSHILMFPVSMGGKHQDEHEPHMPPYHVTLKVLGDHEPGKMPSFFPHGIQDTVNRHNLDAPNSIKVKAHKFVTPSGSEHHVLLLDGAHPEIHNAHKEFSHYNADPFGFVPHISVSKKTHEMVKNGATAQDLGIKVHPLEYRVGNKTIHTFSPAPHGSPDYNISPIKKSEEALDKGANGDWKKEGYKISHSKPDDLNIFETYAHDKHDKLVGWAPLIHDDAGKHIRPLDDYEMGDSGLGEVHVKKGHRRKGLMSAMYQHAEKISGKKMLPGSDQTEDSKALWSNPKRKFGKSEALEKSDTSEQFAVALHRKFGYPLRVLMDKNKVVGHIYAHDPKTNEAIDVGGRKPEGELPKKFRGMGTAEPYHVGEEKHLHALLRRRTDEPGVQAAIKQIETAPGKYTPTMLKSIGDKLNQLKKSVFDHVGPKPHHPHPHAYPWHDGDEIGEELHKAEEVKPVKPLAVGEAAPKAKPTYEINDQAAPAGIKTYRNVAQHYGSILPGEKSDLKHYSYKEHEPKIDAAIKEHGYQTYIAGMGKRYPHPDLKNKNYTTKHLMIWDPTPDSGGDFQDEGETRSWRKIHELSHALTHDDINAKYGEGKRLGKLGTRSPREAKRAVEWEWNVAHKQRELSEKMGIKIPDQTFHKELNTIMHDAVHRAIHGRFTEPSDEGFHPFDHKIPLEHSLNMVDEHAKKLGLMHDDDTLALKKAEKLIEDLRKSGMDKEADILAETLAKGKNRRDESKKVMGGWKTSPDSPRREKQMGALETQAKKRYGLETERAPGKPNASGKIIDKPTLDNPGNKIQHIGNPDSVAHEHAHIEVAKEGVGLKEYQHGMDKEWGRQNKSVKDGGYGYKQQARAKDEYVTTALENPLRRRAGLPAHQKEATPEAGKKTIPKKRYEAADAPGKTIIQDVKDPKGEKRTKHLSGTSANRSPEANRRMDQVDRGELKFHPDKGWHPGTSVNSKINQKARAIAENPASAGRKDAKTLMRGEDGAAPVSFNKMKQDDLKKSTGWSIKLKGMEGYHPVKDVVDQGPGKQNSYRLHDGTMVPHEKVEDLQMGGKASVKKPT